MRKFKRIYIEITNVCNGTCVFCPGTSRKSGFIDRDLFTRILDDVKGASEYLYFHVMGEPLLHPDLAVFLDLCGEREYKVSIVTNGILIDEKKNDILSKRTLRAVNFSLQVLDSIQTSAAIDAYLDRILRFISEAEEKAPDMITCLRLWNTRERDDGKNAYILESLRKFFGYTGLIEAVPSEGSDIRLRRNTYLSQRSFFDWPGGLVPETEGFCLGLRQQAAILVDGTVVPCCLDNEGKIALGNIKEKTFREIVEGKRAMDIYRGFSERKIVEPLCRQCGYRKRFG